MGEKEEVFVDDDSLYPEIDLEDTGEVEPSEGEAGNESDPSEGS